MPEVIGFRLEVGFQHRGQLLGLETTVDDRLEAVQKKLDAFLVIQERRIFRHDRAILGGHDVVFDRDQATAAGFGEQFVEELQNIRVVRVRDDLGLKRQLDFMYRVFEKIDRSRDNHQPNRNADDDNVFSDREKESYLTACFNKASERGS